MDGTYPILWVKMKKAFFFFFFLVCELHINIILDALILQRFSLERVPDFSLKVWMGSIIPGAFCFCHINGWADSPQRSGYESCLMSITSFSLRCLVNRVWPFKEAIRVTDKFLRHLTAQICDDAPLGSENFLCSIFLATSLLPPWGLAHIQLL